MSAARALVLGLLLATPSFAFAGAEHAAPATAIKTVVKTTPRVSLKLRLGRGLRKTYDTLKHPVLISAIINGIGNPIIHHLFGVPYDAEVIGTFMVVGAAVGAGYFPAVDALKRLTGRSTAAP